MAATLMEQTAMVSELRDDGHVTTKMGSELASGSNTLRRHKRKSLEPRKKLLSSMDTLAKESASESRPPKRTRLGSTGSFDELMEEPPQSSSLSPKSIGSAPRNGSSRSPSPHMLLLAPKMRFKQTSATLVTTSSNNNNNNDEVASNTNYKKKTKSKKRSEDMKNKERKVEIESAASSPFRPWDDSRSEMRSSRATALSPNCSSSSSTSSTPTSPTTTTPTKLETSTMPSALPMILPAEVRSALSALYPSLALLPKTPLVIMPEQEEPLSLVKHARSDDHDKSQCRDSKASDSKASDLRSPNSRSSSSSTSPLPGSRPTTSSGRNYKNMTRERRVEANARERQRVHTITAAFDTLQKAIPVDNVDVLHEGMVPDENDKRNVECEDSNNKLSKLAIIKLATRYILLLSRMAGHDYSQDQSKPSVETCLRDFQTLVESETRGLKNRNKV